MSLRGLPDDWRDKGVMGSKTAVAVDVVSLGIASTVVIGTVLGVADGQAYAPDPSACTCECFDRRIKGGYFAEHKQYRHVYINVTLNTALILVWSVVHLSLLLAFIRRAILSICGRQGLAGLRWGVLLAACINMYGLIYGWWVMLNYLNDAHKISQLGVLWATQLFFTLTDLVPAYTLYTLFSTRSSVSSRLAHLALAVSCSHIALALWDQGAAHILLGHHLIVRDLMFLASDVAGAAAVYAHQRQVEWKRVGVYGGIIAAAYFVLKTVTGSY